MVLYSDINTLEGNTVFLASLKQWFLVILNHLRKGQRIQTLVTTTERERRLAVSYFMLPKSKRNVQLQNRFEMTSF